MKSLRTNTRYRRHAASGVSLTELLIVLFVIIIMSAFAALSLGPLLRHQHLTNAYNITMSAMRRGHDQAVAQQTSYSVIFANHVGAASDIVVAPSLQVGMPAFAGDQSAADYQLPSDVQFLAQGGLPATGPDGYGAGGVAIDFGYTASGTGTGGSNTIYFCPDGSSQAANAGLCGANWSGGVVYLANPGDVMGTRALTLWGGTGRIHGWRISTTGGVNTWIRQ